MHHLLNQRERLPCRRRQGALGQAGHGEFHALYLGQTLARYGERSEVLFAQHHWPTWGREKIQEFLADQRDMYAFLNDETLRLLNHGLTPMDIAERLQRLPEPLASKWYARDYYGSVSHNVRAVHQRFMGFYDGNPANLNPLPPVASAKRTIEWMGGAQAVLEKARAAFADPDNQAAPPFAGRHPGATRLSERKHHLAQCLSNRCPGAGAGAAHGGG